MRIEIYKTKCVRLTGGNIIAPGHISFLWDIHILKKIDMARILLSLSLSLVGRTVWNNYTLIILLHEKTPFFLFCKKCGVFFCFKVLVQSQRIMTLIFD
jgi:hypothetical protein